VEECAGEHKEECLGHRASCPALLPLDCWSQTKAFRRNSAPFHGSDKQCTLNQKPDFLLTQTHPQKHTVDFPREHGAYAEHMYAIVNAKGFHSLKWKIKILKSKNSKNN